MKYQDWKRTLPLFALCAAVAWGLVACRPRPRVSTPEPSKLTILQSRDEVSPSVPEPETAPEAGTPALAESRILLSGKAYRWRGPDTVTDAVDYQELGTLTLGGTGDLTTDTPELASWSVTRLGGGAFTTDALLVSQEAQGWLFYPEGFWEAMGQEYLYEDGEDGVTILKYLGREKDVTVPAQLAGKPVTRLGMAYMGGVFGGCGSLERVTVPEGVTLLDDYTFDGCPSLKAVRLPQSLRGLGHGCFQNCPALETLSFAGDAPATGNYVFAGTPSPTLRYGAGSAGWEQSPWRDFPAEAA